MFCKCICIHTSISYPAEEETSPPPGSTPGPVRQSGDGLEAGATRLLGQRLLQMPPSPQLTLSSHHPPASAPDRERASGFSVAEILQAAERNGEQGSSELPPASKTGISLFTGQEETSLSRAAATFLQSEPSHSASSGVKQSTVTASHSQLKLVKRARPSVEGSAASDAPASSTVTVNKSANSLLSLSVQKSVSSIVETHLAESPLVSSVREQGANKTAMEMATGGRDDHSSSQQPGGESGRDSVDNEQLISALSTGATSPEVHVYTCT